MSHMRIPHKTYYDLRFAVFLTFLPDSLKPAFDWPATSGV